MKRRFADNAANMPASGAQATGAKGKAGGFGGGASPVPALSGEMKKSDLGGGKGTSAKADGKVNEGADKAWNYAYFREYAHKGPAQRGQVDLQDTLLWHPTLFAENGQAKVSFDLSQNLTTYRVLIYANSPDGRLGFYEGKIETRAAAPK